MHRLVYQAWRLNDVCIDSKIPIDHIDGFKNHNWVENLVSTTHRANYRKAAYIQNLRTTKWTPEIIDYMCQLMEFGTIGPKDILDKLREKFPTFNISYNNCKRRIYELLDKNFWKDISSNYNIDNYRKYQNYHKNAPSSDELIHQICKEYVSGKYASNKEIATKLNTTETIVNKVLRKEKRVDISSQYDINYIINKRHPLEEEEVTEICEEIIVHNMPIYLIAEKFHREKETIRKIIRRQIYTNITSKYNFEEKYPQYDYKIPYNPN